MLFLTASNLENRVMRFEIGDGYLYILKTETGRIQVGFDFPMDVAVQREYLTLQEFESILHQCNYKGNVKSLRT